MTALRLGTASPRRAMAGSSATVAHRMDGRRNGALPTAGYLKQQASHGRNPKIAMKAALCSEERRVPIQPVCLAQELLTASPASARDGRDDVLGDLTANRVGNRPSRPRTK